MSLSTDASPLRQLRVQLQGLDAIFFIALSNQIPPTDQGGLVKHYNPCSAIHI